MQRFDWSRLLRAAVQRLGLRPGEFWELTPAELMLMFGEGAGPTPLGRSGLEALMAAFPDEPKNDGDMP